MNIEQQIKEAQACYRKFWKDIEPPYQCNFDGSFTDIEALAYLHYEGIAFPDNDDLYQVSLIWGEVLRNLTGMVWFSHPDQRIVYPCLKLTDEDRALLTVHPFPSICEGMSRTLPQDGKLYYLFEQVLFDVWDVLVLLDETKENAIRKKIAEVVDFEDEGFLCSCEQKVQELKKAWRNARGSG